MESANILSVLVYFNIMLLYIGLLYVYLHAKKVPSGKIWFWISVFLLTFFAVSRKVDFTGLGGTDAITYVYEFQHMTNSLASYINIDKILALQQREPLYYLLAWLIRNFTENYKVYFFVIYLIIGYCMSYFAVNIYEKGKKSSLLPLILLFVTYLHSFNVMRNWVAIAICMVGLIKLKEGLDKKFFVYLIIGVGFHYSVSILLLPYIFYKLLKRRDKIRIFLLSIIPSGAVMLILAHEIIVNFFTDTKYRTYMTSQSSWLGYIPVLIIALLAIYFYDDLVTISKKNKLAVIGVSINAAMIYAYVMLGAYRINDCFIFFRIWILIELTKVLKMKYRNQTLLIAITCLRLFIIVYFVLQLKRILTQSGILPYILG